LNEKLKFEVRENTVVIFLHPFYGPSESADPRLITVAIFICFIARYSCE
jgi:hypothetical protein